MASRRQLSCESSGDPSQAAARGHGQHAGLAAQRSSFSGLFDCFAIEIAYSATAAITRGALASLQCLTDQLIEGSSI